MESLGSFRDLFAALWRRAWLIALVLAIGLPLVVLFALSRPRAYEATAVIQIEAPEVITGPMRQIQPPTADSQLDLITQSLMARDSIAAIIDRFGLFPEVDSPTERVALLRGAIRIVKLIDPAQAWRPDAHPTGLSITVRLGDPEQAAAVANALLDQIIAESRARSEGRAARTLEFLVSEEARVAAEIAAIEDRIARFRAENVASLPEGLTAQRDRLSRLREDRLALERRLIEIEGARERFRPEDFEAQRALLAEQLGLLDQRIREVEAAIEAAPAVERELSAMARTLSQLEAEFGVLTARRTEAAMTVLIEEQEHAERFVVLERAIPPEFAVSPSRTRVALAGGAGVAVLAVLLALALELAQPVIRTAADLERRLGVQPVIVVPHLSARRTRRGRLALGLALLAALAAALWAAFRGGAQALLGLLGLPLERAGGAARPGRQLRAQ